MIAKVGRVSIVPFKIKEADQTLSLTVAVVVGIAIITIETVIITENGAEAETVGTTIVDATAAVVVMDVVVNPITTRTTIIIGTIITCLHQTNNSRVDIPIIPTVEPPTVKKVINRVSRWAGKKQLNSINVICV